VSVRKHDIRSARDGFAAAADGNHDRDLGCAPGRDAPVPVILGLDPRIGLYRNRARPESTGPASEDAGVRPGMTNRWPVGQFFSPFV
jgi:hypothetical protein